MLDSYGVTHVFFVPTILNATLVEMEETTTITRVVTHSEAAAAYMADGYARATCRPGVCMAQTVGAGNLAAGLRDARQTSSPVVAITGGPMRNSRHRHQYQEIEDRPMFAPVTKASLKADHIDRVPATIRQAFRTATTGRAGPVHIEFVGHHGDVLEGETTEEAPTIEPRHRQLPPFRSQSDHADVAAAAAALSAAQRPLLIVGGGVRQSQAASEVVAFAEENSIPVVASLTGKDVIPANHPLSAGVVGQYSRETANRLVAEADLAFLVGTRAGSQSTHRWRLPNSDQKVIQVDIDVETIGTNYLNAVSMVGDIRTVIGQLREELAKSGKVDRSAWLERVSSVVKDWYQTTAATRSSSDIPMRPERLLSELSAALPDDAVVVVDTGHAGAWAAGWLDLISPNQRLLRCAGTLGWAFPAGIGAQCGLPDRPVVVFTGDGGFMYHMAELETAARWNIPLTVVVNNNSALNQEINIWTAAYGGELRGRHHELWQFRPVDFAAVAQAMGVDAVRVTDPAALNAALLKGINFPGPFLIDVVTDRDVLAPEALVPDRVKPGSGQADRVKPDPVKPDRVKHETGDDRWGLNPDLWCRPVRVSPSARDEW